MKSEYHKELIRSFQSYLKKNYFKERNFREKKGSSGRWVRFVFDKLKFGK